MPIDKIKPMNRMSFKLEVIFGALLNCNDMDKSLAQLGFSKHDVL